MKTRIASATAKAGIPLFVVDLIGGEFIVPIIGELPNHLLPPVMAMLRAIYWKHREQYG